MTETAIRASDIALATLKAKLSYVDIKLPETVTYWDTDDAGVRVECTWERVEHLPVGMDDRIVTPANNLLLHMLFMHACGNYWSEGTGDEFVSFDGTNGRAEVQTTTITLHCREFWFVNAPYRVNDVTVFRVLGVYTRPC